MATLLRTAARYRKLRIWWNSCTYDEQCAAISLVWLVMGLVWVGVIFYLGGAAYVQ